MGSDRMRVLDDLILSISISKCRAHLSKVGLLVCNLLSRNRGFIQSVSSGIRLSFDHRAIVFPSLDSGNAITFAANGEAVDFSLEEMRLHAKQLKVKNRS